MIEIHDIFEKSKVSRQKIEANIYHIILKHKYEPRDIFADLQKCFTSFFAKGTEPRMLGLSGLRGTGKTTLLWQIADYAKNQNVENVYFFDIEKIVTLGYSVLDLFLYIENHKPEFLTSKNVLLFDEVHFDKKWSTALKIIYENMRFSYIVATGSSALLLQTTADLATRMLILHTLPLHFTEYISITKNIKLDNKTEFKEKLKAVLFFSKTIDDLKQNLLPLKTQIDDYYKKIENADLLLDNYIKYHNIARFTLYEDVNYILKEIDTLYHRVVYEDIPILSTEIDTENTKKLLLRLAVSDEINIQSLSQSIGISQEEINLIIDILAKAEMLTVLHPFGGIDSKINKMKKAFFMSPSIRLALLLQFINKLENEHLAKLYEDIVVMYLKRFFDNSLLSFSSFTKSKNPDFIISTNSKPIILEVGLNKKTKQQITASKIDFRYGIVVSTKINEPIFETETVFLPFKLFVML
jgi:predicted AAA+ superfamily ATPase